MVRPEIQINIIDDFIDKENCFEYLSSDFDYLFDAIDSILAKVALIAHCKCNKYPLLTCGGAGGQLEHTLQFKNEITLQITIYPVI